MNKFVIVIAGSTGTGKTDFSLKLGQSLPIEIVNADIGQLYEPLTIGTAKPAWKEENIPHHLFDLFKEPFSFTAVEYRQLVQKQCDEIWGRNNIPVIVGGSTFYIESLFFKTQLTNKNAISMAVSEDSCDNNTMGLWENLNRIDPQRALEIHPNDTYRLQRALQLWRSTGLRPSDQKPLYDPIAPFYFYYLTRDRFDLYSRINCRVKEMMHSGWIEEVEGLYNTSWYDFVLTKKFIGYPEIINFINDKKTGYAQLVDHIAQKTRNYAKKQETYWRRLEKKIYNCLDKIDGYTKMEKSKIIRYNLTSQNLDVYSKQQAKIIQNMCESNFYE